MTALYKLRPDPEPRAQTGFAPPLLSNPFIGRTIAQPHPRQGHMMFQTEESDLGNTESQPPSTRWARHALHGTIHNITKEVSAPSA